MKGYELLERIVKGKIKKGTKIIWNETEKFYLDTDEDGEPIIRYFDSHNEIGSSFLTSCSKFEIVEENKLPEKLEYDEDCTEEWKFQELYSMVHKIIDYLKSREEKEMK